MMQTVDMIRQVHLHTLWDKIMHEPRASAGCSGAFSGTHWGGRLLKAGKQSAQGFAGMGQVHELPEFGTQWEFA